MVYGKKIRLHGKFGMKNNYFKLKKFWTGKKILITGHTGFKGSWLSIFLNLLGAKLVGYSLEPEKKSSFFYSANLKKIFFRSVYGDIRNYNKLKKTILNFSPDFIVHMAAQPLVKYSYENPLYTYEVNTIGTLNILNIAKETKCVKNILVVTTDKVYLNLEKKVKFKERDKLGGLDPYSSSKSCAELITSSYNYSYLNKKKISVMTARAGNVIGGGDFSKDRIIPDFFRALKKKKIYVRSPEAVRPWQFILDPLYGYLLLLMKMGSKKRIKDFSYNFGPKKLNKYTVKYMLNLVNGYFNNSVKVIKKKNLSAKHKESKILMLDSSLSEKILGWKAKYNIQQSIKLTVDWYKCYLKKGDLFKFSQKQIIDFLK